MILRNSREYARYPETLKIRKVDYQLSWSTRKLDPALLAENLGTTSLAKTVTFEFSKLSIVCLKIKVLLEAFLLGASLWKYKLRFNELTSSSCPSSRCEIRIIWALQVSTIGLIYLLMGSWDLCSPKVNFAFGPVQNTDLYVSGGFF
jgi:hypothetical protein